ncbi:hypothetical protein C8R45DRAFT_941652 [Mycena sanguinolenta]|nr:hypothetical protein C8R45DRAFT_941652 [Mycena sanguinolenta]
MHNRVGGVAVVAVRRSGLVDRMVGRLSGIWGPRVNWKVWWWSQESHRGVEEEMSRIGVKCRAGVECSSIRLDEDENAGLGWIRFTGSVPTLGYSSHWLRRYLALCTQAEAERGEGDERAIHPFYTVVWDTIPGTGNNVTHLWAENRNIRLRPHGHRYDTWNSPDRLTRQTQETKLSEFHCVPLYWNSLKVAVFPPSHHRAETISTARALPSLGPPGDSTASKVDRPTTTTF